MDLTVHLMDLMVLPMVLMVHLMDPMDLTVRPT